MVDYKSTLSFFRGRRVFITGHTGFKGSWLTFILCEIGAEVAGFSLPSRDPSSLFELLNLQSNITNIEGDVRDSSLLIESLKTFRPEVVFHLAAQALVCRSYDDPLLTFSTNIMGSAHLLEAVNQCDSVRSLVYITSDKCYENAEWAWGYRENDPLGGRDPYSASKAACELIFSAYKSSFLDSRSNFGAASVRAGNVIGGGDWSDDRIIPDCIRSIHSGLPLKLRSPLATRPWQHVLEPLSGYLLLAFYLSNEPKYWSGAWNFGPETSDIKTVESVAESIISHIGKGSIEHETTESGKHEAMLLQLNCDKAHQLLDWRARWSVDKTLEQTALWYKCWMDNQDITAITRQQTRNYFVEL